MQQPFPRGRSPSSTSKCHWTRAFNDDTASTSLAPLDFPSKDARQASLSLGLGYIVRMCLLSAMKATDNTIRIVLAATSTAARLGVCFVPIVFPNDITARYCSIRPNSVRGPATTPTQLSAEPKQRCLCPPLTRSCVRDIISMDSRGGIRLSGPTPRRVRRRGIFTGRLDDTKMDRAHL